DVSPAVRGFATRSVGNRSGFVGWAVFGSLHAEANISNIQANGYFFIRECLKGHLRERSSLWILFSFSRSFRILSNTPFTNCPLCSVLYCFEISMYSLMVTRVGI